MPQRTVSPVLLPLAVPAAATALHAGGALDFGERVLASEPPVSPMCASSAGTRQGTVRIEALLIQRLRHMIRGARHAAAPQQHADWTLRVLLDLAVRARIGAVPIASQLWASPANMLKGSPRQTRSASF